MVNHESNVVEISHPQERISFVEQKTSISLLSNYLPYDLSFFSEDLFDLGYLPHPVILTIQEDLGLIHD
jgi:hypothetical protein